jgi:hypothetical protein
MIPSWNEYLASDFWIAIPNPPDSGSHRLPVSSANPVQYNAGYLTCSLRDASISTNITFVDNAQSLQTGLVRIPEFVVLDSIPPVILGDVRAIAKYKAFQNLVCGYLLGYVGSVEQIAAVTPAEEVVAGT